MTSHVEQLVVFVVRIRSHQRHQELRIGRRCGTWVLGRSVSVHDPAAQTAKPFERPRQEGARDDSLERLLADDDRAI